MDLYLHSGGRAKGEYFPDQISGLTRCSRTEIHDDIEFIQANLPFNAQQAAAQQQQQQQDEAMEQAEDGEDGGDPNGAAAAAPGQARVPQNKNKRKMTRAERAEAELSVQHTDTPRETCPSTRTACAPLPLVPPAPTDVSMPSLKSPLYSEREAAASKRARLQHKISQER
jgi:hypothetical protein